MESSMGQEILLLCNSNVCESSFDVQFFTYFLLQVLWQILS